MILAGKKVLFIAPSFFGCDLLISDEIIARGASVLRLFDRPYTNNLYKSLAKFFPRLSSRLADNYYLDSINSLSIGIDIILVVNGQTLSERVLKEMASRWPSTPRILYLWDSLENRRGVMRLLDFYDVKFSFDPVCCQKYNFFFRSLFFGRDSEFINSPAKYLFSFVGTAHSDRYQVVKKISDQIVSARSFIYFYLQAKWVYWFRKYISRELKQSDINEFNFVGLSPSDVSIIFSETEIFLDVEHPDQVGLTIRTFETIKYNKKLITTNEDVKNYDFFKNGNVLVVDRESPVVPVEFLNRKLNPYDSQIQYKYSVSGWLDEILEKI